VKTISAEQIRKYLEQRQRQFWDDGRTAGGAALLDLDRLADVVDALLSDTVAKASKVDAALLETAEQTVAAIEAAAPVSTNLAAAGAALRTAIRRTLGETGRDTR
jgi:hypothetical protein